MTTLKPDDPLVRRMLRRAMVGRIATLSHNGRPSINPLYFTVVNGQIWLGTADWTLAARNARADSRVSVLLNIERRPHDRRLLRVTGQAAVLTDAQSKRAYIWRVALKYSLSPGGLLNSLRHLDKSRLIRRYHQQSAAKGQMCLIAVTPEQIELLEG